MTLLKVAVFTFFACIAASSAQTCYGRVRNYAPPPTPTYVAPPCPPEYTNAPPPPCRTPCTCTEDYAPLQQLISTLNYNQCPYAAKKEPCGCSTCSSINSSSIIEKLIDALIITASQKNNQQSALIDVSLLQGLLNQGKGSSGSSGGVGSVVGDVVGSVTSGGVGGVVSGVTGLVDGVL